MVTREQIEALSRRLPGPMASAFREDCLRQLAVYEGAARCRPEQRLLVMDLRTGTTSRS